VTSAALTGHGGWSSGILAVWGSLPIHFPWVDDPAAFAAAISAFLS
jgi:hypothetical protein